MAVETIATPSHESEAPGPGASESRFSGSLTLIIMLITARAAMLSNPGIRLAAGVAPARPGAGPRHWPLRWGASRVRVWRERPRSRPRHDSDAAAARTSRRPNGEALVNEYL